MFLKRLEVQGFKSLADKIELHFGPGITAIVGPNGVGKSNIADAVRWVLGEQNVKSLRGARLEDIIFSGSSRRKPVGMAEVSLTLDNSADLFPLDYSEITVTRKVYRSGESEFMINKSPCRLRDIYELFMDTGIGREGYSIIGQGKIDEILSAKSEDRRVFIEEAAGIIKYKTRKQQAVKKLSETTQNLVRINDIINELAIRVEPLREQSEKAREFLGLQNELVDLEINLLVNQIEEQKGKLAEINKKDEVLRRELVEAETIVRNLESGMEGQKLLANKLDEEMANLQKELYDLGNRIERKEAQIMVAGERLKDLEARKENWQKEISELSNKETLERIQLKNDEQSLTVVKEKIKAEQDRLAKIEEQLSRTETEIQDTCRTTEEKKADIIDLLNEIAGVRNSINTGEIEMQNLLRRIRQLDGQKGSLAADLLVILQRERELEDRINNIAGTVERLTGKESILIEGRDILGKQLKNLSGNLAQTRQLLQNKSFRLKALKDLQKNYEGCHRGVKEVLAESRKGGNYSGICGMVAEIIKVPEKYETAVEIALGSALQFIITENEDQARKAIEFLKKNKAGRATFLPLTNIKPEAIEQQTKKLCKQIGFHGLASDLIQYEDKYSRIIKCLLGNVAVTENIDQAVELAQALNYRMKVVTLDGDVVNTGGSITGGADQRGHSSLLARIREIEEIGTEEGKLDKEVKSLEKTVWRTQKEYERYITETTEIQAQLQNLKIEKSSCQKDNEVVLEQKTRLESAEKLLDEEIQNLNDEIAAAEKRICSQKLRLQELQGKDEEIRNSIAEQQGLISGQEKERAQLSDLVTQIKVSLASLYQEELSHTQLMNRVMETIKDVETQRQIKEKQVNDFLAQQEFWQTDIRKHQQEIKELRTQKESKKEHLNRRQDDKQALVTGITKKEDQVKNLSKKMVQINEQLHASDIKRARCEFESENSLTLLAEEFQVAYEEALLTKREIKNKREVITRIKDLKETISALGNVNLGAIEEFGRVKERYDFLHRQYDDLEEAKESLYKVIAEMDQIMTGKFRTAFTDINNNFGTVFVKLFGGGKAELILTNGENLLESGIEIQVQPPGKKLQHLSLLSGGERALTAISLLFAILKTKPIPFCVLDEIESSLDEANVDRFTNYLKEFAFDTQFIAITHRKRTMEAADVLYGLTMDESGVTKTMSMKLSEAIGKVS